MHLSPAEKLMMLMLSDIAKEKDERILNYNLIDQMLLNDEHWNIDWDIFLESIRKYGMPKSKLVTDILDMCLMLCDSYRHLTDSEKAEFLVFNDGQPFVFHGFSPTDEPDYYALEQSYLYNIEYYKQLRDHEYLNIEGLRLPRYLRMLELFNQIKAQSPHIKRLSKEGMIGLISI